MTRQNAQEWPQIAPGSIDEWENGTLHSRRSAYNPKLWSLMSPHGVFIEGKRAHLCMGVVKGEEKVNWDTERMARGPKYPPSSSSRGWA